MLRYSILSALALALCACNATTPPPSGTPQISTPAPLTKTSLEQSMPEPKDDSITKIDADFRALPGNSGYLIAKLSDGARPAQVAGLNTTQQFAIASTFKLYVLAELTAQIEAGDKSWAEVVPLANRSYSSHATKGWPENAPMTLHSLASHMTVTSDNSAADTLLFTLGRENVESKLATIGHSAPDKTLPFLGTAEAFALKSQPALQAQFAGSSEAVQRQILKANAGKLGYGAIDPTLFDGGTKYIDTVEWFASPADLALLLNHLRKTRNNDMLAILAINDSQSGRLGDKWRYVGYKGGYENGVVAMSYLVQSKAGNWYAVTGSWNNADQDVSTNQMTALMNRLLSTIEAQ